MILTLIEKTKSEKLYRTYDGKFEMRGVDLNCTTAAARAAGAGPVWMWRPINGKFSRGFATKAKCLMDLNRSLGVFDDPNLPVIDVQSIAKKEETNG